MRNCKAQHEMPLKTHKQYEEMLEWFMLALCLWREARGEPIEGKAAVADVVLTRVADPRWPNTIAGVITQKYQFSAFNPGDPNTVKFPLPGDDEFAAWLECAEVAEAAIQNGPSKVADHYYAAALPKSPRWAGTMKRIGQVGGHVFLSSLGGKSQAKYMGD